jgi:hypothetical protein
MIGVERLAQRVETLGFAVCQAGFSPMAISAQALKLSRRKRVPIACMRDDVVGLGRGRDVTSCQTGLAQRLLQQLVPATVFPEGEVIPLSP